MKIITTLIGIMGFQYMALCQAPAASTQMEKPLTCSISYSEKSETLVNEEFAAIKCREIVITSLPPESQSATNVTIDFGMTGSFTFKKDASLEIYNNNDVYLEDMLTGKVFDLKTSESYTFNVNRRIPNRFVLHIDKMLMRYAMSSK